MTSISRDREPEYHIGYIVNTCRFDPFKRNFQPNYLASYMIIIVMKKYIYPTSDEKK
jgi:hypothetical protein